MLPLPIVIDNGAIRSRKISKLKAISIKLSPVSPDYFCLVSGIHSISQIFLEVPYEFLQRGK
jgi:hypothetical protein